MLGKLLDRFRQKGPSRPRSRAESEKRRRFIIVLLIVLAVVSSLSVVGYGYYDTSVRPWHGRILKVNGTVFDMRYFVKMMRLNGVTSSDYTDYVVSAMEENELAKQGLESEYPDVDIGTVTGDEAVEAKIREILGMTDNSTEEEFDEQYDNLVTNLKTHGLSERDLKELYIEPSLISEELKKQIGDRDYPATDNFEHAQVQALLVTGSDNATQLRARWEAGEAFDTLSTDNSVSSYQRDTATDNTTIEWVAKGIESTAFDDYTFSENTSLNVISQPILDSDSSENYWVIKVIAWQSRPLSESDRNTLISEAFSKWLEDAKNSEDNVIVNYLDKKGGQAKLAWAVAHVAVSTS